MCRHPREPSKIGCLRMAKRLLFKLMKLPELAMFHKYFILYHTLPALVHCCNGVLNVHRPSTQPGSDQTTSLLGSIYPLWH